MNGAMLAKTATPQSIPTLLDDNLHVAEQKMDGDRKQVVVRDREAFAYNRNGEPTSLPVQVARCFDHPGFKGEWLFDGELVDEVYYVFDLLAVPENPEWGHASFAVRRAFLETLFDKWSAPLVKLVPQAQTPEAKQRLFYTMMKGNYEGVIFKRLNAKHQPNKRSWDFLKFKFVDTADVIVEELKVDGREQAIRVSLYHNGEKVDAGGCKIPEDMVNHLQCGDVIECRYLYATKDFKLYQPVWVRYRDDKRPEDCTTEQLKFTNKEVVFEPQ